jgi:antitoxin MazE
MGMAVKTRVVKPRHVRRPREGWEEQFRAMAERGDDRLLDEPTPTKWDETEWEWQPAP